jgi:hypothetical protein
MLVLQNRLWATLYLIVAMSLYVCYSYLFKWFGTLRYYDDFCTPTQVCKTMFMNCLFVYI